MDTELVNKNIEALMDQMILSIGPEKFLEILEKLRDKAIRLRDCPLETWTYKEIQ